MNNLWSKVLNFNDKYFPRWREKPPVYYSNALAGEVGEVCNAIKHLLGGGTNRSAVDISKVTEECVDVLIYLVLLLETLGVGLEEFEKAFQRKLLENVRRMEGEA